MELDLRTMEWLANYNIPKITLLISNKEKVKVIMDSSYHAIRAHVSKEYTSPTSFYTCSFYKCEYFFTTYILSTIQKMPCF